MIKYKLDEYSEEIDENENRINSVLEDERAEIQVALDVEDQAQDPEHAASRPARFWVNSPQTGWASERAKQTLFVLGTLFCAAPRVFFLESCSQQISLEDGALTTRLTTVVCSL